MCFLGGSCGRVCCVLLCVPVSSLAVAMWCSWEVPGVPAACTSSQLYGTPCSWLLPLGRDARWLAEALWTEPQLRTKMKSYAWCCAPLNEAGHVSDDPRSLTRNDTVRQQTLVVTAHVNEPLRWRCKPIDGRHHSSKGRLQLEYPLGTSADWREPTRPESHIDHEHLGAASLQL